MASGGAGCDAAEATSEGATSDGAALAGVATEDDATGADVGADATPVTALSAVIATGDGVP